MKGGESEIVPHVITCGAESGGSNQRAFGEIEMVAEAGERQMAASTVIRPP